MSDAAAAGQVIAGRYELVRRIAAGPLGSVYEARQRSTERLVALALIEPQPGSDEVARRFDRQMQMASRLEHPGIVRVLDHGTDERGRLFVASEEVAGQPLSRLLAAGALPTARVVDVAVQLVRALGAAHAAGLTHGRLTLDDVLVVDDARDVVQVRGFGLAGVIAATPPYAAPEAALGHAVDHRADFYALGVMLYQLSVGRLPFDGAAPPSPSTIAPPLEALIGRLLARSPAERPSTATELEAALEAIAPPPRAASDRAATTPSQAPSPKPSPTPSPKPSRRRLWPLAVAAVALVAAAGVVVAARLARRAKLDEAAARARLDAVAAAEGDPMPPPGCRTTERTLIDRLARAGAWLHDATVGSPRPQDRDALALLANVKDAAGSAEYWALLSRARLVVDATTDGALAAARTALERCPELAQGYSLVGDAEQRAQRFDAAASAYERALALVPDYVAPRFNLGLLSLRAGDQRAAAAAFDAVLARDPLHPRAHLARGQARLFLGQITGALDDLEQATLRHPTDASAWFLLGQARVRAGANTTAVEAFCKARQLGNLDAGKLCR